MSDLLLTAIYDQKKREFAAQNIAGGRFDLDFVDATNATINRINREADLDDRIPRITDINGTVELDEDYADVLSAGISIYLMTYGHRPAKGADAAMRSMNEIFKEGIAGIADDLRNDLQEADPDDETYT